MFGEFDVTPYVLVGTFLFAVAATLFGILWAANHPDPDPLEEWYGPTELEDTPFVIEQLTAMNRETV